MDERNESHKVLWGVQRSVRYHDRRERFYYRIRNATDLGAMLLGSMTVALFSVDIAVAWPLWVKLLPAAAVTLFSGSALIYQVAFKATLHRDLKRRFISLEKNIRTKGLSAEEACLERLNIEADEPPILRTLDTLCHNELVQARGEDEKHLVQVSTLHKAFANWR